MIKNRNKSYLIKDLSTQLGYSNSISKKLISDLIFVMSEILKNEDLILKNLGTFKLIKKKSRIGRNPKTKKEFIIKERLSISFSPSINFKNKINEFN